MLSLHPEFNNLKKVSTQFRFIPRKTSMILWHDALNNTVTPHPKYPWSEIKADLLVELLKQTPKFVGVVHTVRKCGPKYFNYLEKHLNDQALVLSVITDSLSKKKQNDPV